MTFPARAWALSLVAAFAPAIAFAEDLPMRSTGSENVFVMAGPFSTGYFGETFLFWQDHYERNLFAGFGYQRFVYVHPNGFALGVEAGGGVRAGESLSGEIWAGLVTSMSLRFDSFTVTPSVTAGLSAVSGTVGIETERARRIDNDVPVLFYLAPEIAIGHDALPNLEVFTRIQHRSGGFGTIADIDGSNAFTLGVRRGF